MINCYFYCCKACRFVRFCFRNPFIICKNSGFVSPLFSCIRPKPSMKWIPETSETSGNLMVKSKLSLRSGSVDLRNWIPWSFRRENMGQRKPTANYFHKKLHLRRLSGFEARLCNAERVRLNYATTHHHPPPPTMTHHHPPPRTTTTHHQPKYIHHHPPPAKIYPRLPTISQKMDHHPAKAKTYSYITSVRHCFNSFFFFEMQYFFPWWRFCVIKFWSVRFSNSKFLLHSVHFTIFKIC